MSTQPHSRHWLWDVRRLAPAASLIAHTGCVNRLTWSVDTARPLLASASDDTSVIIWRDAPGARPAGSRLAMEPLHVIDTGHSANIFGVAFLAQTRGSEVATGAMDDEVRLHTWGGGASFSSPAPPSAGGAPAGGVRRAALLRTTSGWSSRLVHTHRGRVKAVAAGERCVFFSASEDGTLCAHDTREARGGGAANCVVSLNYAARSGGELKCVAVSPQNAALLALGASDSFVRVLDRRMLPPTSPLRHASRADANRHVLLFAPTHLMPEVTSRGADGVKVGGSGVRLRMSHVDIDPLVTHVEWSPDGTSVLATYSGDGAYVFDVSAPDGEDTGGGRVEEEEGRRGMASGVGERAFAGLGQQARNSIMLEEGTGVGGLESLGWSSTSRTSDVVVGAPLAAAVPAAICAGAMRWWRAGTAAAARSSWAESVTAFSLAIALTRTDEAAQSGDVPPTGGAAGAVATVGGLCVPLCLGGSNAMGAATLRLLRAGALLSRAWQGDSSSAIEDCTLALPAVFSAAPPGLRRDSLAFEAALLLATALKAAGHVCSAACLARTLLSAIRREDDAAPLPRAHSSDAVATAAAEDAAPSLLARVGALITSLAEAATEAPEGAAVEAPPSDAPPPPHPTPVPASAAASAAVVAMTEQPRPPLEWCTPLVEALRQLACVGGDAPPPPPPPSSPSARRWMEPITSGPIPPLAHDHGQLSCRFRGRYVGAVNRQTDIKEAAFWPGAQECIASFLRNDIRGGKESVWRACWPYEEGEEGNDIVPPSWLGKKGVILASSDDGCVWAYDAGTGIPIALLDADDVVVNAVRPHPTLPLLATSGIGHAVTLWAPSPPQGGDGVEEEGGRGSAAPPAPPVAGLRRRARESRTRRTIVDSSEIAARAATAWGTARRRVPFSRGEDIARALAHVLRPHVTEEGEAGGDDDGDGDDDVRCPLQ